MHAGANYLLAGIAVAAPCGVGATRKVEEVGALSLVKTQRPRERFEDAVGDPGEVASLDAGVVLDTDPGKLGHLVSAQALNAALPAVARDARLFGSDLRPT